MILLGKLLPLIMYNEKIALSEEVEEIKSAMNRLGTESSKNDDYTKIEEYVNKDFFCKDGYYLTPKKILVNKILSTFSEIFYEVGLDESKISGNTYAVVLGCIFPNEKKEIEQFLNDGKSIAQLNIEKNSLLEKLQYSNSTTIKELKDRLTNLIQILSNIQFTNPKIKVEAYGRKRTVDMKKDFVEYLTKNSPYVWKYFLKKIKTLEPEREVVERVSNPEKKQDDKGGNALTTRGGQGGIQIGGDQQQNKNNNKKVEEGEGVDVLPQQGAPQGNEGRKLQKERKYQENLNEAQDVEDMGGQAENGGGGENKIQTVAEILNNNINVQGQGQGQGQNQDHGNNGGDNNIIKDERSERSMTKLIAFSMARNEFSFAVDKIKYIIDALKVINNDKNHGHKSVALTVELTKENREIETYKFYISTENYTDGNGKVNRYSVAKVEPRIEGSFALDIVEEFKKSTINKLESVESVNAEKIYNNMLNELEKKKNSLDKEYIKYTKKEYEETIKNHAACDEIFNQYKYGGTNIQRTINSKTGTTDEKTRTNSLV